MDPDKFTTVAHRGHVFCNPLGEEAVADCLDRLALAPADRVLDMGCGKGEVLIRLVEKYGVRGVGVDLNASFLAEAAARAAARVPEGALELHRMPGARFPLEPGAYAAALCIGATQALGGYRETLRALAGCVRPGGSVLVGEGYWKREPDPEYLAFLGASRDECGDHANNLAAGREAGLLPVHSVVSGAAEWDAYEDLYARTVLQYVAYHPEDPDASALAERIHAWREGYLRWGRDTLGFGLYLFRKPSRDPA